MPAQKANYLVLYTTDSQVYATATEKIALESPPPPGVPLEEKRVFFVTYQPDTESLVVHKLPDEKVQTAELNYPKKKEKIEDE